MRQRPGYATVVCENISDCMEMSGRAVPVPESRSVTSKRSFNKSIQGMKLERWMPFLYSSSGWRLGTLRGIAAGQEQYYSLRCHYGDNTVVQQLLE